MTKSQEKMFFAVGKKRIKGVEIENNTDHNVIIEINRSNILKVKVEKTKYLKSVV